MTLSMAEQDEEQTKYLEFGTTAVLVLLQILYVSALFLFGITARDQFNGTDI